jgi:hypothetical protein
MKREPPLYAQVAVYGACAGALIAAASLFFILRSADSFVDRARRNGAA